MILYQYQKRIEELPSDGSAYLMPNTMWFANKLMADNVYSTEVNIINRFRDEFAVNGSDLNFIDIGANIGTYTMVLGRVFNHTYSFEPGVNNYNILCGNVALNNLSDKTTLINKGLSDKRETIVYNNMDALGGNNFFTNPEDDILDHMYDYYQDPSRRKEIMEVDTLDSFNIKNVGLIKIDVEGFEYNVLKGAVTTIKDSKYPPMLIESWNPDDFQDGEVKNKLGELRNELFTFLDNLGYSYEYLNDDLYYCVRK